MATSSTKKSKKKIVKGKTVKKATKKTAKKKKTTIGNYTPLKKLSYKKKLTKSEKNKYKKLEKKAKKATKNALKAAKKKSENLIRKLAKGGLTKSEGQKIKKKTASLIKSAKNNKAVKKLNKYKKRLDKKYNKKPKSGASKAIQKVKKAETKRAQARKDIKGDIKSKAKNRAYMINNATNQVFMFQFNPEKVPYERKVSYNSIDAPGQAYPQTQFAKGEALEFTVDLFMYTPVERGKVDTVSKRGVFAGSKVDDWDTSKIESGVAINDRIDNARAFLQDLIPPYSNKGFGTPPTCTFAFGYFVCNCVVTGLKVEDERLDVKGNPIQTKFTVSLRRV